MSTEPWPTPVTDGPVTMRFTVEYCTFGKHTPEAAHKVQLNIQNILDLQMTRDTHGINTIIIVGEDRWATKTPVKGEEENAVKRYNTSNGN